MTSSAGGDDGRGSPLHMPSYPECQCARCVGAFDRLSHFPAKSPGGVGQRENHGSITFDEAARLHRASTPPHRLWMFQRRGRAGGRVGGGGGSRAVREGIRQKTSREWKLYWRAMARIGDAKRAIRRIRRLYHRGSERADERIGALQTQIDELWAFVVGFDQGPGDTWEFLVVRAGKALDRLEGLG